MNVMNELLKTMQNVSASQPRPSESSEPSGKYEFEKLLKDYAAEAAGRQESGSGTQGTGEKAPEADSTPDDALQQAAAALAMMANMAPPVQIQTQEVLPEDVAVVVEPLPQHTPLTEAVSQETPYTAAQETVPQETAQPAMEQTANAPKTQTTQTHTAQTTGQAAQAQKPQQAIQQPQVETVNRPTETVEAVEPMAKEGNTAQANLTDSEADDAQTRYGEAENTQTLFRDVKATPVKVGDAPVADTTAKDLDAQLAKQIDSGLAKGAEQVTIRLAPESLGAVTIDLIKAQDGTLQVVLHTSNDKAANLLNQHAESIGALLQNSTQSTVQVEVPRQDQQNQQFQQQGQHQNGQNQQQGRHRQSSEDFLQQLRLGLIPLDEQVS